MKPQHLLYKIKTKELSLSLFAAVIFVIFSFSGSTDPLSIYISVILLFVWVTISLLSNYKAFYNAISSKPMLFLYIHLLFLLLTSIQVASGFQTAKLIGTQLVVFSPLLIFEYYKQFNIAKLKVILYVSVSAMIILAIKALVFYSNHRDAARRLAADQNAFGSISIGGGYSFAFAATILIVYIFEMLLNKVIYKRKHKMLSVLFMVLMLYLVLETKSTLTIISLFFGLGLSLLNRNSVKRIKGKILLMDKRRIRFSQLLKVFMISILTIMVAMNIQLIGRFILSNVNGSDVVSQRINEVGIVLANGFQESDYFLYRLDRPMFSVTKFLESPIVGQGYKYGYIYKDSLPYMGGHSEWLDSLANYGLIGALPFFMVFYISLKKSFQEIGSIISCSYIATYIIMGFLNPLVVFHTSFVIFLIIPSLIRVTMNQSNICSAKANNCETVR